MNEREKYMLKMNEREKYMLKALIVIAAFRKDEKVGLRPYMDEHKIKWNNNEDVKTWVQRIAKDAIRYAMRYV